MRVYEIEQESLQGGGVTLARYKSKEEAILSAKKDLWRYDLSRERINVNEIDISIDEDGEEEREYLDEVWSSTSNDEEESYDN